MNPFNTIRFSVDDNFNKLFINIKTLNNITNLLNIFAWDFDDVGDLLETVQYNKMVHYEFK